MSKENDLVYQVLSELDNCGLLQNIFLIGGWCLPLYYQMFKDDEECTITVLRTTDIDFMIPNPPRMKTKVNVVELLTRHGFSYIRDPLTKYSKFVHEEMEVEFLIPDRGKGYDGGYEIKDLNISAQPLRYITLVEDNNITVPFNGIPVRIPSPEAFVMIKLIVSTKRANKYKSKAARDIQVAVNIGEYLLTKEEYRHKMVALYNSLPKGWKKDIDSVLRENSSSLYSLFHPN